MHNSNHNTNHNSNAPTAFKQALAKEKPLQIVGVINAISALLAEQAGFQALYLSGAGVANAVYGLPDLGMTTATEVAEEIRRITKVTPLPLLVDADTGFGGILNITRTVKTFESAGACGLHIEDQEWPKRCGHRPLKRCVSVQEMGDRIKAAVDAKEDPNFIIMARTDAFGSEDLTKTIERAHHYIEAGAEMIFVEALTEISQYETFVKEIKKPILANVTEFGKTPLFPVEELKSVGVAMALYPLSGFRAMNFAALKVFQAIRQKGTQKGELNEMQTREALYELLHYYEYEEKCNFNNMT